MPNRTKLTVVTAVVLLGVGAAFFFRKSTDRVEEDVASSVHDTVARDELAQPLEKPAPTSHLTGRIDPAEQAADFQSPARADNSSFGLAAPPAASGAYSALRPSSESAASAPLSTAPSSAAAGVSFSELRRHKIVDGDTLSGLAVRYLGSADRYREIYELNRAALNDPDLLPIGTELKIPAAGATTAIPATLDGRPMVPVAPRGSTAPPPTSG